MSDEQGERKGFFKSKANIALIGFGLIAGFFLLTEHTAHVFGILPYLLLLACPLLHFFGHGGHGGHGNSDGKGDENRKVAGRDEDPHRHHQ